MSPLPPHPQATWLAGATGLVGREIAAQWPGPGLLHLLVRRPWPSEAARHPLHRLHRVDFAALDSTPALPAAGAACCCLGSTLAAAGSRAAFRAVDFDAVLAFARAAQAAGVQRLAVVSALGADAGSRSFYCRVKGEAETALADLGFQSLVIARPSLLVGDRHALGQAPRRGEWLALRLTRPLQGWIPSAWRPIEAATVARALLRALPQAPRGCQVLESGDLQQLGAS